jgi:O-antigen ligase
MPTYNTSVTPPRTAAAAPVRQSVQPVRVAQALQPTAGLARVAAVISLFYLVIAYGRLSETFLRIPHIAALAGILGLVVTALSGGLIRAANFRSGRILIALTVWFILCIPFSSWPGGSVELLTETWLKSVAVYLLLAGTIFTFSQYRSTCYTMVAALILLVAAAQLFGISRDGRFALDLGSLGNPNDFAAHLLIAVPFLLLVIDLKGFKSPLAWIAFAMTGVIFALTLKTGSRSGLLTLLLLVFYRFLRGSIKTKAIFMMLGLIALAVAPLVVSPEAMERYLVMLGRMETSEATSRQVEFAEGSKESRLFLLQQSLVATFTHPLFGVGPGTFSTWVAKRMESEGVRGNWAQTHNTFTQWSSELGLIGGGLFILLVIRGFSNGRFVWKRARGDAALKPYAAAGEALIAAVLCFAGAGFFGNYAYFMYMPMLAACGEALRSIAESELPLKRTAPVAPAFSRMPISRRKPARPA